MGKNAGVHIMKPGLVASLVQHCSDLICKFKKTEQQGRLTMSQQAVKEYLLSIILIYQVSSKAEKSVLLDHAELVTKRSANTLSTGSTRDLTSYMINAAPGDQLSTTNPNFYLISIFCGCKWSKFLPAE